MVWTESIRQATEVLEYWTSQRTPITASAKHVRTLSLHVLSNVGFGKSYSFRKAGEPPTPGHLFNYRDALAYVLDHIMLIVVLGPKLLRKRFLPKRLRLIGQACVDFDAYMRNLYNDERQLSNEKRQKPTNIMTSLIHASEELDYGARKSSKATDTMKPAIRGLSESEVYGNTFLYNFAGHDTTAITLSWAIYLLAAHPEVQDWISEEINEYVKHGNMAAMEYGKLFPKLKRCLAVMVRPSHPSSLSSSKITNEKRISLKFFVSITRSQASSSPPNLPHKPSLFLTEPSPSLQKPA